MNLFSHLKKVARGLHSSSGTSHFVNASPAMQKKIARRDRKLSHYIMKKKGFFR